MYYRAGTAPTPGVSGFGVIGDAERQQAAVDRATAIIGGVEQTAVDNILPFAPALDKLATGALYMGQGRAEDGTREWVDGLATAAAMAGPVGAALASVFKVLTEGMLWLAKEYPAEQVCCAKYLDTELPRMWGATDIGRFYREEGWVYVASYLYKTSSSGSFPSVGSTCGYSDCHPTLTCGYFNGANDAARENALRKLCAPKRYYKDRKPSIGYNSWVEYENYLKREGKFDAIQTELDAADKIGNDVFAKLQSDGELRKFSFAMGDLCWAQGFAFKVKGLPNHTLLNLIRKLALLSPDARDVIADVEELTAMEEVVYPDLPEKTTVLWVDMLANAIAWSFAASDQATYHMFALLNEYNNRLAAGTIKKPGSESAGSILAKMPFLREAMSRISTVRKIGSMRVKIGTIDPTWKAEGDSKPWYKSPWTYVGGAVALGGLGYLIYKLTRPAGR